MNFRNNKLWKDTIYTKTAREFEQDHPHRRLYHAVVIDGKIEQLEDDFVCFKAINEKAEIIDIIVSPRFVEATDFMGGEAIVVYFKDNGEFYYYDVKPLYEEVTLHTEEKEQLLTYLLMKDIDKYNHCYYFGYPVEIISNFFKLPDEDKHLYIDAFIRVDR